MNIHADAIAEDAVHVSFDATRHRGTQRDRHLKVLYLIDTLEVGGAEQSLLQILPRFASVQPVVCHLYAGDTLRSAYEAAGIPVFSLDVRSKYGFLTAVRRVDRMVRRLDPDVIHTTLLRSSIVGRVVGRLRRVPVVGSFVSDSYAPIRYQRLTWSARGKLRAVQMLDRATADWCAAFMANSEAVRAAGCAALGIERERATVVYRGREAAAFASDPGRALEKRKELGIPPDAPVVLNVGRLVEAKGQAELIRAFSRVRAGLPDALLLIAGEGPLARTLESLAASAGLGESVRLLGRRDDIPELLSLADVFAFPSHFEGHPGALVEAMLAGKAIVATDIAVHRECVEDRESAVLVPVEDPLSLGQGIIQLLLSTAEATRFGERARARARSAFDIDEIVRQYEEFYASVVGNWFRGA